jgi:uncharacterized repeat protein (TIGR02543 family)
MAMSDRFSLMLRFMMFFLLLAVMLLICPPSFSRALEFDGFVYVIDGDTAIVTGYTGSETNVVIPAELDGKPVVAIGESAFSGKAIVSVTMPDSVRSVGNGAFSSCNLLRSVTFPSRLDYLGRSAFSNCLNLGWTGSSTIPIVLPNGLKRIENSTFVVCSNLMDVTLPEGLISIGQSAFANCRLYQVNLPSTLLRIEEEAFRSNTSLARPSFPSGINYIGRDAFYQNNWLDNASDEWLIVGQGQLLKYGGSAVDLQIPGQVKRICSRALANRTILRNVYIPDGVTTIDYFAFAACNLSSIRIPTSVTTIQDQAFSFGNYAMSIRGYPGSEAEFFAGAKSITFIGLALATFDSLGGSAVPAQEKDIGSLLVMPADPSRTGHQFSGWYKNKTFSTEWIFSLDPLNQNTTLYARWQLPVPSGFSASRLSSTEIRLAWNSQAGVTGYEIYRATQSAGPFSLIREQSGTTYTNTGLNPAATYYYQILAYSTVGDVRFKSNLTTAIAVQALPSNTPVPTSIPFPSPTTEATPTSAASATPLVTSIIKPTPSLVPTSTPFATPSTEATPTLTPTKSPPDDTQATTATQTTTPAPSRAPSPSPASSTTAEHDASTNPTDKTAPGSKEERDNTLLIVLLGVIAAALIGVCVLLILVLNMKRPKT